MLHCLTSTYCLVSNRGYEGEQFLVPNEAVKKTFQEFVWKETNYHQDRGLTEPANFYVQKSKFQ